MKFFEPTTVDDAIRHLSADAGHRCLAGGATLVAMMNAGLVEPTGLVSLAKIPEIRGIARNADGSISIGAMTLHQSVADSDLFFRGGHELVRDAARQIGHPAIRNMGTIGGSISHADSAADYPTALVAADAQIEIAGPNGRRAVSAAAFFVDYLQTSLTPGELVIAVRLPPSQATSAYLKFARVDGDFATVSVGIVLSMEGNRCGAARIAIGGCGPTPVRVPEAERRLIGTTLDEAVLAKYGAEAQAACDPVDDFRGSAEYRLMLVPVMLRRTLEIALSRGGAPV